MDIHIRTNKDYQQQITTKIDSIIGIYLKIENVNCDAIDIEELIKNNFFDVAFYLSIGIYNTSINCSTLFIQSTITTIPIENGHNYITIPLFIFSGITQYGISLINIRHDRHNNAYLKFTANPIGANIFNHKDYKSSIDIIGKCYNEEICASLHLLTELTLFRYTTFRHLIYDKDGYRDTGIALNGFPTNDLGTTVSFLIFSVIPHGSCNIKNLNIPKIKSIGIQLNELEPIEYRDELIVHDEYSMPTYTVPFNQALKDIFDFQNMFNKLIKKGDNYCGINLKAKSKCHTLNYKITYDSLYSMQDIADNFKLILTVARYADISM